MPRISTVVFDIGNVLIRWDPRFLYRKLIADEARMERFLAEVCTPAWNLEQDRGRDWPEAVAELVARHPGDADLIRAFDERWAEMVPGPIEGSVAILEELAAARVPLHAITNFSAAKWAETLPRFPFLALFGEVVVSAHERVLKPDAAIYRLLLDRRGIDPRTAVFVDDSAANVAGAEAVGMTAIRFTDPDDLRLRLRDLGLPLAG